MLQADLHLADRDESCWSVSKAFSGMHNGDVLQQEMLSASKIPMPDLIGDLRYRQQNVWGEANALSVMVRGVTLLSMMLTTTIV
eukprot:1151925-Pelagomonas_calceolata.AAC.1